MADVRELLRSLLFTLLFFTVSGQSPNCKYIQEVEIDLLLTQVSPCE